MNTEFQPLRKRPDTQNPDSPMAIPPAGVPQPFWPPAYPAADEIDLVDLGVMFWRQRRLVAWVAAGFIALSLVAAVLKKPAYEYTIAIQLGALLSRQGELIPLQSPQAAAQALRNTYVPNAILRFQEEHKEDLSSLKVDVGSSSDSATLSLSCKVSTKLAEACIAVEKAAAANFVQDNERAIAAVRVNLQAQLQGAKLQLAALQDPTVFGVQKLAAEKAIADAKNALATLQAEAAVLKVRKAKLQASVGLYQKEAAQLQAHITDVRKAAIGSARGTSTPTEAMANLILSTEEQRSVDRFNAIQQKLAVTLPEELATVDKNLADNTRAQALQKQTIAQNELALQKLLFDHNQQIEKEKITISNLQTQLQNILDNRVLGEPLRSLRSVGLGRAAILAIGIVLSVLFAILAAFLANYVEQVRRRLAAAEAA